jgi:hypothetical protein
MSLLKKLTPINIQSEKEKFFSDLSYNPQFEYENEITEADLYTHGFPSIKLVEKAKEVVDRAFFHQSERDILDKSGSIISPKLAELKIIQFLKMHNLDSLYSIQYSSTFIARASIYSNSIKLRLPIKFTHDDLIGMIYHELGTHVLRQVNYQQQPWYKKKKSYGFSPYLKTEEGLAVLHSLLPRKFQSAYRSARYYIASYLSQENSFSGLYHKLEKYFDDPEKRWTATLRQKRGLRDTSNPGGFTKDIVYFEGLLDMLQWLSKNNFELRELYYGKISVKDVKKAVQLNPTFEPILPSFYISNINNYKEKISKIGSINNLFEL